MYITTPQPESGRLEGGDTTAPPHDDPFGSGSLISGPQLKLLC
jgi:hypothetical protein